MARTNPFDPAPGYVALQEEEPLTLARMTVGKRQDVWLVTRYQEAREVLADTRFSSDSRAPGYPLVRAFTRMIRDDPPDHTRFRQMLTSEFLGRRVTELQEDVQRLTDDLLDGLAARPAPVDLVRELAMPLPSLVICRLLGVPYDQHEYLQERTAAALSKESTNQQIDQAIDDLGDYLEQIVRGKMDHPTDDLLSRFVVKQVHDGTCTFEDAVDIARLLLVAGHVTTVNMIGLGVLVLLRNPRALAELRAEPRLIPGAVDELLRYLSITGGVARVATEDVEVAGRLIRKGQGVLVLHSVANRDPREFPEPDRFDIHRDAHRHLAFGHGPHLCLGMLLARMEMRVVLGSLMSRFPGLRLAVPEEEIPFRHAMRIYGIHELPVTW
ncbi:putative cytochrome P450 [Actinacidiphila reveromycinica]|uniref:Putative cytochrome P450 n=2 Tax=Actinacidiphila reveromycinica TaxID=659352 RepID=A0A7U3VSK4_9ACTN|nr:putative cytochrome P450 [Streptomyces sp. SN-593]